jgi:hypothetical protein
MLNLPTNTDQLRAAIKTAIEFYQGSPVKNENKLNEALAASLGFKNYDQLAPEVTAKTAGITKTYDIQFDYAGEHQIIINGVRIDTELVHEGFINYTLAEREDRISDIRQWIGEAASDHDRDRSHDIYLMQQDLDSLLASKEEYVLEAYGTSGFIAADVEPELFQQTCNAILKAAAAFYKDRVGELTKTGVLYEDACTHYGADDVEVYAGELVLIKESYLSDDYLPIGMAVEKFNGSVPEGYIAAYTGTFGEYVPVKLNDE